MSVWVPIGRTSLINTTGNDELVGDWSGYRHSEKFHHKLKNWIQAKYWLKSHFLGIEMTVSQHKTATTWSDALWLSLCVLAQDFSYVVIPTEYCL